MWQRNLGLVMIVGASLLYYQAMPRHCVWTNAFWTDAIVTAPLSVSQPTVVRFTADEDAWYCPTVGYRYTRNADAGAHVTFAEPKFTCTIREENRPSTWRGRVQARSDGDGRMYLLKPFAVTKGRTYTVSVNVTQGQALLQGRSPRMQVIADPAYYYQDMMHGLLTFCTCAFWGVVGLLLTFWGRSLAPLRGWRRITRGGTKP